MDVREMAQAHEPKQTKNVTELESLNLQLPIEEKEYTDKEGKTFTVNEVIIDNEAYRVPISVIGQIKAIVEVKPETTEVKVTKSGEGLNTQYQTIPL